ncbi:hypothetical protein ALC62_09838 [Cyphomyrmex costatus]|uniref:Uncharacterized protein n=1 Tax=Cyphomyrmex costatus TaxID=456900 RepID=A0A195CGG0_9HYME|nr:hypothetical protein ALC62_09838 [Cyphomyrmex costatus]
MYDINLQCHFYRATFGKTRNLVATADSPRRRLKLLAAEDGAYPQSRCGPVSRAKRVYALMPSLFLGVIIVVVVFLILCRFFGTSYMREEAETAVGSWRNAREENIKGPKEATFQASRKPDIYENTLYGTPHERIGNACRRTTSRSDSFSFGNETREKYEGKRSSKEKRN